MCQAQLFSLRFRSPEAAWNEILRSNNFLELNKLIRIIFTIPLTSVENERIFSRINKI